MAKPGLVSVVMATYNMATHITQSIDSVLAQTYRDLELIVVNDGSTDRTTEVIAPYLADNRIRVVAQENAGQTVAKNRGIAEAQGEFIAFCDADDTWEPDKLARQLPLFDNPRVGVVFSDITCIDSHGATIDLPPLRRYEGVVTAQLLIDNFVPFCTAVVRHSALASVGAFDVNLTMSIDYDLWLRLSIGHEFGYVRAPLANYRLWEGQMSHRMGERFENFFGLMERFFARYPDSVSPRVRREAWAHSVLSRAIWHRRGNRYRDAWRDLGQAARLNPLSLRLWRTIAATALRR